MANITRNNVNVRISNRVDSVNGILGADLLGSWLLHLRCLVHQLCFAFVRGNDPRRGGAGSKRYAYEPAATITAMPRLWQMRLATSTARGARSAG